MKNLLAKRLTELLSDREMSKRAFAKEIGVSNVSVSDWTTGKVQPTAENIYLISEYLSVSADFLLGLSDDDSPVNFDGK